VLPILPRYGIDQSKGPINLAPAERGYDESRRW